MRITDKQVQQVLRAYGDQMRKTEKKPARPAENVGHEIQLSPESQDFLAAMQALKSLPETDQERVAELKQQIESGTYQVDSERIARQMLTRNLVDRLL